MIYRFIQFLIICAGLLLALIAAIYFVNLVLGNAEIAECDTWQAQAAQYPVFYLANWQAAQCAHYGIEITND